MGLYDMNPEITFCCAELQRETAFSASSSPLSVIQSGCSKPFISLIKLLSHSLILQTWSCSLPKTEQ